MRHRFGPIAASVLSTLFLSGVLAQEATKAKPANEVEISFANGSNVRMVLADLALDVQTPYGKLAVPVRDIKQIEFGVHLPDGMELRIEQELQKLAGENFRDRESATVELIKLGAHAYPAVHQAAGSSNLELAKRAKTILQTLVQKLPTKELRLQPNDTVVTPSFTIVGRILTPTIKAQAEYFGEVQLPLTQLRTLRSAAVPAEVVVSIDAARYCTQNASAWMATDFVADARARLTITASGQVDLAPQMGGQYVCTPRGFPTGAAALGAGGFGAAGVAGAKSSTRMQPGALLGRIGEHGATFVIGERFDGSLGQEGKLYLMIAPSRWSSECTGSYQVKINSSR